LLTAKYIFKEFQKTEKLDVHDEVCRCNISPPIELMSCGDTPFKKDPLLF
jgi:hypothetical protein